MAEIDVPSYFICPITMEIMRDPVAVSTGITYDRESIERWIFYEKNNTCPVTKQLLFDSGLTPNITLRRLIQFWCTVNSSKGVERLPTPRSPVSESELVKIMKEAVCPETNADCLNKLREIASQNQTNRRCMESVGVHRLLGNLVVERGEESEEALIILHSLRLSEPSLLSFDNVEFIGSLVHVMQNGSFESRAYAIMLMKSILEVAVDVDQGLLTHLSSELFTQLIRILNDQISEKASNAALKVLCIISPLKRYRLTAVEAGAVPILVNLLLENSDRRTCEMTLLALDILCQIAEGRAELLKHGAGLAIVSKKILRVSAGASERAVKILHSISKFSANPGILQEMLELGVVSKLCLVIQVRCGSKTKERAREILKMNARSWRNASCIPNDLVASFSS